ncbi:acyltransferase [Flavobacteriaceae bacterium]|nr:acyltransferase [Flavobacteriaceae bacterium]MDB9912439.1 acyltransferase [Flavobacteriaceae bacterium]
MSKLLSYRPDIDGLRAISVIFVILFHADLLWIQGGFIGVDVFFVISGYLITRSIDKEMLGNVFSFKAFYLRRIRRIIPVLVFVMLVITIPACLFLFANDLETFGRTALHTILSTNNFYLWIKGSNYFVGNTELMPLLHTWSLSVEEQFYFIWPLILLLLHRYLNLKNRLYFIILFIVIGLGLSVFLASFYPKVAYFLLPARLFELSLGAGLALFWDKIPELSRNKNNGISVVGLLLILLPVFLLNGLSTFPGFNAFYPCLGAVLLILSGKNTHTKGIVNRLLTIKPLVFIGLLSYSMYLWHWPIFSFIKYVGLELTPDKLIVALTSTVLLSYFSWKFIEKPFRYRFKYNFSKTLLVILLPCLLIVGAIYGVLDGKDGFPGRHPTLIEFDKKNNYPSKLRRNCYDVFKVGNCDQCGLGVKKDTLDGVLIGDSFANHSAAFIDVLAKDSGLYFHDSAAGGYPLLYDVDDQTGAPTRDTAYGEKRLAYAKKFKTIIVATNWERFLDKQSKNYKLVMATIKELLDLDKNVIIIDPLRTVSQMNLHKMKLLKTNNGSSINKQDLLIPFYKRADDYIVYEIHRKYPQVTIINLNDIMCYDTSCNYEIDNSIVYRNGNHLNTSGATLLAKKYILEKGNPLKFLQ